MTKGGFVKLNDDGQPAPAPEEQLHEHEHEHEHDLEDVSLSGTITGEAPAWLAAGAAAVPASRVRRGSSDETVPASTASSAFPSTDDLTSDHQHQQQPPPPSRRPQGPLVQAPAPPKRGGRAAGAGAWLGCWWLAVALLLASMNPSVLSGLMYKSAAAEDYVYTPVSILGAANLCGLLVAVRAFWRDILKAGALTRYEWAFLVMTTMAGPCLSAFYLVDGLRLTSVPIAAVLSRLDAVFLLAFATLVYGPATPNTQTPPTTDPPTITTRLRPLWPAANALLLLLAALLAAFTRDPRLPVEHGDWAPVGPADGSDRLPSPKGSAFLALGAILAALTQLATRAGLQRVPVGLLVTARMLGAFLLFHPMALAYGGPPALRAIYHPRLWLTMLWYAPAFVWLLGFAWLRTIKGCPPRYIAYGLAGSLVLELLWARVLIHQPLTFGESIAAGLCLTAGLSALTERWYRGGGEAWTEEDDGMPAASSEAEATTGAATHNSSKPGDLEEAKEEAPAAMVTSTLRRRFVDTTGVAPGREVTLRHRYV